MEKLTRLSKKHPEQVCKKDKHNFTVPKRCVSVREPYSAERRKAVAEVLAQQPHACALRMVGVFDVYGESGTPQDVLHKYGIDAKTIVNTILTQPFQ